MLQIKLTERAYDLANINFCACIPISVSMGKNKLASNLRNEMLTSIQLP